MSNQRRRLSQYSFLPNVIKHSKGMEFREFFAVLFHIQLAVFILAIGFLQEYTHLPFRTHFMLILNTKCLVASSTLHMVIFP